MKRITLFIFLAIVLLILLLSSCASNPYWAVHHNDGVENRTYMKRGWTNDVTCTVYDSNRPVQRSTWAKQYYWKPLNK
jgi:hypothetical protein